MRALVAVLVIVGSVILAPGTASADEDTYKVNRSWKLTHDDGEPRIVPHAEDDVIELTCHNEDLMKDWWVNDKDLVARSWEKADGTGVQVRPDFPDDEEDTATLRITLVCEESGQEDSSGKIRS
jgi:hypothetical protein